MNPVACFLFFCFAVPAAPVPSVPDDAGGFVPFTNSRAMPDGSLRPYDPAIDGVMGPDGRVYFPRPPDPYPPQPYPPGRVEVGPPEGRYRLNPVGTPPSPPASHRRLLRCQWCTGHSDAVRLPNARCAAAPE